MTVIDRLLESDPWPNCPSGLRPMPGPRRDEPMVGLGDEREYDVPECRVTRVEDRDPELLRVDGVGEDPVVRGVVRRFHGADKSFEGGASHPDVQPEGAGPSEIRWRPLV
ncbi:MAG: hypothetical protein QOI09_2138, partial [Chloroflexota bacterium]|nr:hypothetical protein [Chloroflexota bacterium]